MKRSVSTARCTAAAVDEPTPLKQSVAMERSISTARHFDGDRDGDRDGPERRRLHIGDYASRTPGLCSGPAAQQSISNFWHTMDS